jgi:hypothetical protein
MRIVLSAVISPDVTLDVVPAVLPEARGGIALRFELYDGPICFTLTAEEAGWLSEQIARQLTEGADPTGGAKRRGGQPGADEDVPPEAWERRREVPRDARVSPAADALELTTKSGVTDGPGSRWPSGGRAGHLAPLMGPI